MPVWTIVKTIAPRPCGRPDTLLSEAECLSKQASNTQTAFSENLDAVSATAILWTLFCDLNYSDGVVYIAAGAVACHC